MKRSEVHRYEVSGTAHSSALVALDLAVSPETVVGKFAEANVFFSRAPRPVNGGESSSPVRTRSDDNELGTVRQPHEDIDLQACIAAGRSDDGQLLHSVPRCHCDYPQPPDADLITVEVDHSETSGVKRNTKKESRPDSKISASPSSWWRRSKKFVTDFVVYVACAVCLCC
ncbi:unnamed protein product [Macrosiphum euphorbiae]|uniref:Uncharacterized protein n=1 Tax=Macrosiphum euphorbiae TaxID=13131 RepID=A0AAV0X4T0_9HEMI|nr:unnamed protein product [Macrosiphum euphorbiae]